MREHFNSNSLAPHLMSEHFNSNSLAADLMGEETDALQNYYN